MVMMGVSLGDHFLCVSLFVIFSVLPLVSTNFFFGIVKNQRMNF